MFIDTDKLIAGAKKIANEQADKDQRIEKLEAAVCSLVELAKYDHFKLNWDREIECGCDEFHAEEKHSAEVAAILEGVGL